MSFTANAASFADTLDRGLLDLDHLTATANAPLERLKAEIAFAARLAELFPEQQAGWQALIAQAVAQVRAALSAGSTAEQAVNEAETLLKPIGEVAKNFTIHCIGHAHIDMNWMWAWPETVATVNDTFTTVDRLMDEFPDFRYSQSQASIYQLMKDYLPWLYETVKRRVREGRWEITANQWVEGDKNMASGESICRHALLTKRFFAREFGLPYDAITIDWEPDTFGHPHTVPTLISGAGVKRYYFCRTGPGPHVFWWQGPDGSRVLAFDDLRKWYNNRIDPDITKHLFDFHRETGMKDYLLVYGVGDHGGGPTRQDLRRAVEMNTWPIFPNVKFSTTADFFTAIERQADNLPVIDAEMNYIFEGCYTTQSRVKLINRRSEHAVVEAEMAALLGRGLAGLPYPADALAIAWQHTLFNQFHDILPGSGVRATYDYAEGLFQEIMARTTSVKTHALRAIAGLVNTAACCPHGAMPLHDRDTRAGQGLGGGMGDLSADGAVTRLGTGGDCCDPFVIFNPTPWPRTEVVTARLWNRAYRDHEIVVQDDAGQRLPAQFIERKPFWWLEHEYIELAFPVDVPALGYRAYGLGRSVTAGDIPATPGVRAALEGISKQGAETTCFSFSGEVKGVLENAYLRVEVDQPSGAIVHLIDKRTGANLVPPGARLGLLEYVQQAPTGMSAWNIGQPLRREPFLDNGTLECLHKGPHLGVLQSKHTLHDSTFTLDISLAADSPRVEFTLTVNWLERGTPETGIPSLNVSFPLAVADGVATFECPNGWHTRPADGREVPAQRWVDLTGTQTGQAQPVGATLLNDCKYGFSVDDATIRMSLLRSSYDPDPLPDQGQHVIRFAVQAHVGQWCASDATRAGASFNQPLNVVSTTEQTGPLPSQNAGAELLTPNVMLSGMKKAEDDDALIVRLYEMEGRPTTAQMRLAPALAAPDATAVQTDILEVPLAENTAVMRDGVLSVEIPAFGLVTVKIGDA